MLRPTAQLLLFLAVGVAAHSSLLPTEPAFSNRTAVAPAQEKPYSLACFIAASQCPKDAASGGAAWATFKGAPPEHVGSLEGTIDGPYVSKYVHRHKALLPLNLHDILGFAATIAALVLAASSGVGGGGLLIPIYMLIFGFRAVSAVALSNFTIVGGTLTNFMFNVGKPHPSQPGPLIDWDLILVMEPSTILGALAGGYINHVLPAWLTTVSLSVLLAFVTVNLLRRGALTFRSETLRIRRARIEAEQLQGSPKSAGSEDDGSDSAGNDRSDDARLIAIPGSEGRDPSDVPVRVLVHSHPDGAGSDLAQPLLEGGVEDPAAVGTVAPTSGARGPFALRLGSRGLLAQVPLAKFGVLVLLLAGVIISDTVRTRLRCPSVAYWLAAVAMAPVTVLVLLGVREYLVRKHHKRAAAPGFVPAEGEVAWTRKTTIVYPALCTFAGLVAGMFGVGGGIIKGPLMLEMGVHPQVAAATSATMILFTSAAASTVFISFGAVKWDYAAVTFPAALIFTAVGQLGTKWIIDRMHGRSSIIIFAMAAILGCSSVVLGMQGGLVARTAFEQHQAWDWGSVCGSSPQ